MISVILHEIREVRNYLGHCYLALSLKAVEAFYLRTSATNVVKYTINKVVRTDHNTETRNDKIGSHLLWPGDLTV